MSRSIGSVSIHLGDTDRDESACIIVGSIFIHGTVDEMIDFANEILTEATKQEKVVAYDA